jgi:hypothetical protein
VGSPEDQSREGEGVKTFTVLDVEQRSEAWLQARVGMLTSTCADALLATGRGGEESAQRKNLVMKLALEIITGKPQDRAFKQSAAMQYGVEREAEAFAAYEATSGELLTRSGLIVHPELRAATSLDGHTPDFTVLIEAKAPEPAQHLDYLLSSRVPLGYYRQCLHHFWMVPQAQRLDWFSWCGEFPEPAQTKVVSIHRDGTAPIFVKKGDEPKRIADELIDYDKKARALLAEVDEMVNTIRTFGSLRGQLEASVA